MGKDTAYEPHLYDTISALETRILALERREVVPIGSVLTWTGDPDDIPPGFLLCDGSLIPRERVGDQQGYPELYGVMGTRYDELVAASEFQLPPSEEALVWYDLPFATGWGNYGAGFCECAYSVDRDNIVRLRGLAYWGGAGSGVEIAIVPTEYWPNQGQEIWPAVSSLGVLRVDVVPTTGIVTPNLSVGAGGWVSLTGISYSLSPPDPPTHIIAAL